MSTMSVDLMRSDVAEAIVRALSGLRFGAVEIVVHDGRIAHIERRERVRLDDGEAVLAYLLAPEQVENMPRIFDGDWIEWHRSSGRPLQMELTL